LIRYNAEREVEAYAGNPGRFDAARVRSAVGSPGPDMRISARLVFVLASQLLLLGFLAYNYVVFFQPDKIVAGAVGIASAIFAIALALAKLLPANSVALFQDYVYFIYRNIGVWVLIAAVSWLVSIGWSYQKRNDVFGRLIYVKNLQESLAQGALDRVSLPDPAVLATAFSKFPNRREVPFLLVRSSRLLYQAGRQDIFRSFQREFLEKLKLDEIVQKLCGEENKHPRHDGITFLLSIMGEAYAPKAGLPPVEHRKDVQEIIDKFTLFHNLVAECRRESLEAQFQLIKFEDEINDLSGSIELPKSYKIEKELDAFEVRLKAASRKAVLEFWQSHGAQEYLDFLSYRLIAKVNEENHQDPKLDAQPARAESIQLILESYGKLLLLRQSSLQSGDVEWSTPPYKLTLFYAFMIDAKVQTLVWKDVVELYTSSSSIEAAMAEFTNRKVFEEFRSPRGWYAGTPLDFRLNGSAVSDKINTWLKSDW
jgi:hypothetical protein